MKILLIHTRYTQSGGEDTVVQQELELLQASYQVDTLFFQNKEGLIGAFQFLLSIWNVVAARRLRKKIKSFQPDVIHIHNWHFASGPILFRVAKQLKIPIVLTVHNYRLLCPSAILLHRNQIFTDSLQQNFPWSAVNKKVYRDSWVQTFWLAFVVWFHKRIGTWKLVDRYICLTPFAVNLYVQSSLGLAKEKFVIKPNYSYASNVHRLTSRGRHFLFIGRFSEEKGIKLLTEAFENNSYKLRIAGSGPLRDYVIDKCNQNPRIEYIGSLDKNGVVNELMKCSALVFPSIWYEGMPLTLIEAFACSTPVIASNLGAMSGMIVHGENGLHFNPNDVEDLKDKLKKWMDFSETEKEAYCASAIRFFSEIYSIHKQVKYLEKIYLGVSNQ